jgi:hypothetical protein
MERHSISFDELVDWVDERLEDGARQRIEVHLESGCAQCAADVAWLRHLKQIAHAEASPEPPRAVVVRAKHLCMPQTDAIESGWAWLTLLRRRPLRLAWGALLLVLLMTALSWPILIMSEPVQMTSEALIVEALPKHAEESPASLPIDRMDQGIQLRTITEPAALLLFDGSSVELQPGAKITLDSIRKNIIGSSYRIAIDQGVGSVHYNVANLKGLGSAFKVRTPGAVVSVQGTAFVVTVTGEGQTRVSVVKGRVRVRGDRQDWLLLSRDYVAVSPVGALSDMGILAIDELDTFGFGLTEDDAQGEPYPAMQVNGLDALDDPIAPSSIPRQSIGTTPKLPPSPRPSHTATAQPRSSATQPAYPEVLIKEVTWPPPTRHIELPDLPSITVPYEPWPTITWPWAPASPMPPTRPVLTRTRVIPTWPAMPKPPEPPPTPDIPTPALPELPPTPDVPTPAPPVPEGPSMPMPTMPKPPDFPTAWPSIEVPLPPAPSTERPTPPTDVNQSAPVFPHPPTPPPLPIPPQPRY